MRGTITLKHYGDSATVYAIRKPIPQSEFFAAAQSSIRPAWMFQVRRQEYATQDELECEGVTYRIYRTFPKGNYIELYCEVRVGG